MGKRAIVVGAGGRLSARHREKVWLKLMTGLTNKYLQNNTNLDTLNHGKIG